MVTCTIAAIFILTAFARAILTKVDIGLVKKKCDNKGIERH